MARTENQTATQQFIVDDDPTGRVAEAAQAVNTLALMDHQASENAQQLALQLNYDGTLTVGALEDEIRFYQRRTVEACLELGKRLLILKELTPFGEFKDRVKLLGIEYTTATRFMAATMKFSKVGSNQLLKAAGNQTKLLELLVLDDGEIEGLESGESVRGITLDQIETMSVSELKKALREAREQAKQVAETKDLIIQKKDQKINQLDEQLATLEVKRRSAPETAKGEAEQGYLNDETLAITSKITASLNSRIVQLFAVFDGNPPAHIRLAAAQAIGMVITSGYALADDFGLKPETKPDTAADEPARRDAREFEAMLNNKVDLADLLDDEAKADLKRLNSYKQVDIEN
jgi:hypothetical protein